VHEKRHKDRENKALEYGKVNDESQNHPENLVKTSAIPRGAIVPPIPFTAYEVYAHLVPEERGQAWATPEQRATS